MLQNMTEIAQSVLPTPPWKCAEQVRSWVETANLVDRLGRVDKLLSDALISASYVPESLPDSSIKILGHQILACIEATWSHQDFPTPFHASLALSLSWGEADCGRVTVTAQLKAGTDPNGSPGEVAAFGFANGYVLTYGTTGMPPLASYRAWQAHVEEGLAGLDGPDFPQAQESIVDAVLDYLANDVLNLRAERQAQLWVGEQAFLPKLQEALAVTQHQLQEAGFVLERQDDPSYQVLTPKRELEGTVTQVWRLPDSDRVFHTSWVLRIPLLRPFRGRVALELWVYDEEPPEKRSGLLGCTPFGHAWELSPRGDFTDVGVWKSQVERLVANFEGHQLGKELCKMLARVHQVTTP